MTIDEKFDTFLEKHPHIWKRFCELADNIWNRGIRHYSSKTILEVIRYHSDADQRPESKFKLDNCLTPILARKYMELHPEREGFFSIKSLKKAA